MVDKRFFQPAEVNGWVVVIYEVQSRFTMANAKDMIGGLIQACNEVGE
jgi:eukaryotic translation initiation factor 2C